MYLGDAGEIESHLNNDWTVVLKNLKLREDHHYELLQYNRRIISKQREDDDELFVNDEILHHHQEVAKIVKMNADMETEEKDIIEKYEGAVVSFEEIVKLMGRVGARVLETCQSSLDKCKSLDEELVEKHHKMKTTLVKLLNQKDKINLEEITGLVITYTKIKLLNEIEKLRRLIKAMENGEFQKLEEAYQPKQPRKPIISVEKKRDISVEKVKVSSVGKDPKPSPLEEIKKQEKLRKEKQKLAARLVHGVYSTMELAKQQFIEDMCGHQKQKINRLYNQIFSRNKFNHEQIIAFQAKKDEFQEKVKIFKEMMERESRRLSEAMLKKPVVEKIREEISQSFVISKKDLNDHNFEDRSCEFTDSRTERRLGSNRYRISSPKAKREVRDIPSSFTSALQSTQQNFTHFKFDTNNNETYARTNRNKLPQIGSQMSRGTSLDHRLQISKSRQFRQQMNRKDRRQHQTDNVQQLAIRNEKPKDSKPPIQPKQPVQRTKMPLKNIEVGVDGVVKKDEVGQSKDKRKIEPNPMEYTFYVKRSGHKFYQPKHNIIF